MILSNFIKAMSGGLNNAKTKTTAGFDKKLVFSNYQGGALPFSDYSNNDGGGTGSSYPIGYLGVALSSDITVPTVDDYRFVNFYTGNSLTSVAYSVKDQPMQTIIYQVVRNDGVENVVINSVGIFGRTTSYSIEVLLTKTLLDTPVTVAPGEVKTITVTINYNSFVKNVNA